MQYNVDRGILGSENLGSGTGDERGGVTSGMERRRRGSNTAEAVLGAGTTLQHS